MHLLANIYLQYFIIMQKSLHLDSSAWCTLSLLFGCDPYSVSVVINAAITNFMLCAVASSYNNTICIDYIYNYI